MYLKAYPDIFKIFPALKLTELCTKKSKKFHIVSVLFIFLDHFSFCFKLTMDCSNRTELFFS